MFLDARELANGTVLDADVCIVGAGAAGITLARELADRFDVLVLESGGFEADAATTALNDGDVVGAPLDPINPLPLDETRLRFFGGTTNHWAGYCRPFDPVDFERREHLADSGWPFGRETLDPYYERAAVVVGIGRHEFRWQWWDDEHDAGAALLEDDDWSTKLTQVTTRGRFGPTYRDELEQAPRVRVALWANAVDVELSADGSHVDHVACATLTGRTFSARARAYVVATGGIEVPRLLLASSRSLRPAGLGNEHDLVGRYFMEHLNVLGGAYALAVPTDAAKLYVQHEYPAGHPDDDELIVYLQGEFVPTGALQAAQGLMSLEATLTSLGFVDPPTAGGWTGVHADDIRTLTGVTTGHRADVVGVLRLLCEQSPNPDSRVTLTGERDALGMPRVALDWRHQRIDRESIVRGLALLGTALGRHGIGRVQAAVMSKDDSYVAPALDPEALDPETLAGLDFGLGTGFHHMGTARMHADARHGVVDADCRVHSVPNLFVAGSAVFPTSSSSPPTFTLTALALRLADHLREKVLA